MTVIVSVVNLTSFSWAISQATGLTLAAKSTVRADEAMAADRLTHSTINNERILQKVD